MVTWSWPLKHIVQCSAAGADSIFQQKTIELWNLVLATEKYSLMQPDVST